MIAANVETELRARGLSLTPQRRAVLRYLEGNLQHPTAQQVLAAVTADFPVSSRATVYNTLQLLVDLGFVRALRDGDETRFDPNTEAHHHLHCTTCGRIEDVPAPRVEVRLDGLATAAEVRFEGRCSECRG